MKGSLSFATGGPPPPYSLSQRTKAAGPASAAAGMYTRSLTALHGGDNQARQPADAAADARQGRCENSSGAGGWGQQSSQLHTPEGGGAASKSKVTHGTGLGLLPGMCQQAPLAVLSKRHCWYSSDTWVLTQPRWIRCADGLYPFTGTLQAANLECNTTAGC